MFRKRKRRLSQNERMKKNERTAHLVAIMPWKTTDIVVEKDVEKKEKKVEKRC